MRVRECPLSGSAEGGRGSPGRLRLGRRLRSLTLTVHIVSAAAWLGVHVSMLALVADAALADHAQRSATALAAAGADPSSAELLRLVGALAVSGAFLLAAMVLSAVKPFGRIRRTRRPPPPAPRSCVR